MHVVVLKVDTDGMGAEWEGCLCACVCMCVRVCISRRRVDRVGYRDVEAGHSDRHTAHRNSHASIVHSYNIRIKWQSQITTQSAALHDWIGQVGRERPLTGDASVGDVKVVTLFVCSCQRTHFFGVLGQRRGDAVCLFTTQDADTMYDIQVVFVYVSKWASVC